MEKYFKIGEISKLYDIGVDSLRYYEEIGLISPERSKSGYRLYSLNDIWKLNVIRDLRQLDFSMERIGRLLESHNIDSTLRLLEEEKNIIEERIEKMEQLKANVERRMRNIESACAKKTEVITEEYYPRRSCFSIPESYTEDCEMDMLIKKLIKKCSQSPYIIGNNQIGTVIAADAAVNEGRIIYESVFIPDDNGKDELPEGKYLCVSYRGEYSGSAIWLKRLLEYAENHGMKPSGEIYEILLVDIHTTSDVKEQITELQLSVV